MRAHQLPRLPLIGKLLATMGLFLGWTLFFFAWLAAVVAAGWGISLDIVWNLGELLRGAFETTPLLFWLAFATHALSLVILLMVNRALQDRLAMPRGFRTLLRGLSFGLAAADLAGFLLVPSLAAARLVLGPLLLFEAVFFALVSVLPLRDMWVYSRWRGGGDREQPVRVVIVGGGFAGLYTALSLDQKLGWHQDLQITVVDQKNYFLFPPMLPSVAVGAIETRQVTTPFRQVFEATNITFRKERVESVNLETRSLRTRIAIAPDPQTGELCEIAGELEYDILVLAPGARTNTFNVPGAKEHAFFMRQLGDAISVRNHMIDCFEQAATERNPEARSELLRIVVVGAGPTGVEFAAESQDLIHNVLLGRYPEIRAEEVQVVLVQSGDQVLPGWHDVVAAKTQAQLERIEVRLVLGDRVCEVGRNFVVLQGGERITTRTPVWCTGVKPAQLMETLGIAPERGGRLKVEPDLRLPGRSDVFVLGDVAWCEDKGKPLPALAQVALQQGGQTGPNIVRIVKGKPTKPFKYLNYGALVCVGEHYAVVDLMGVRFGGFVAWFTWRSLYLSKLVGLGNRIRVVMDWTMDLLMERSISQIHDRRLLPLEEGARDSAESKGRPAPAS